MKKEHLFEAIGEADEKLLERSEKNSYSRSIWIKTLAIAACFAIIASFGISYVSQPDLPHNTETSAAEVTTMPSQPAETTQQQVTTDLPPETTFVLTTVEPFIDASLPAIPYPSMKADGMGFEGYRAFDISEIINANPWSEELELSTLPVYKNHRTYNEIQKIPYTTIEEMENLLLEFAERLGLDTENFVIQNNAVTDEKQIERITARMGGTAPDGYFDADYVYIELDGMKLEVDRSLTVTVQYEPGLPLPDIYNTDGKNCTDTLSVAGYLKNKYSKLIGMENPQIDIYTQERGIDDLVLYQIKMFEGAENITEQIINYNFNNWYTHFYDNGDLFIMRFYKADLSDKMGDYPIITANEAKELLMEGRYITTVCEEIISKKYVKKVELVYRKTPHEQYYMPYYRFYVELPSMEKDNGMKVYGAYYVPAVEEKYLTDIPVWDGSFN